MTRIFFILENLWDRRIVPDNEYYDSDEGEAQGSGENVTSGHERDYNDDTAPVASKEGAPLDVKMSLDEEAQIAEALEEPVNKDEDDKMVTDTEDNVVEEEDTVMTEADNTEKETTPAPNQLTETNTPASESTTKTALTEPLKESLSSVVSPPSATNNERENGVEMKTEAEHGQTTATTTTQHNVTATAKESTEHASAAPSSPSSKLLGHDSEEEGEVKSIKSHASSPPESHKMEEVAEQTTSTADNGKGSSPAPATTATTEAAEAPAVEAPAPQAPAPVAVVEEEEDLEDGEITD